MTSGDVAVQGIGELEAPDFSQPIHLPLLAGILVLIGLTLAGRVQDRFVMLLAIVFTALAIQTARFQPIFALAFLPAAGLAARDLATIRQHFDATGVCWGPYQTFAQMIAEDPRCSPDNPLFHWVEQPDVVQILSPVSALDFESVERRPVVAPRLGEHTDEILSNVLRLSGPEIAELRDERIVA